MSHFIRKSRPYTALGLTLSAFFMLIFAFVDRSDSASPASGTITPIGPTLTWAGAPAIGSTIDELGCVDGVNCDTFTVTLSGTPASWAGKKARIEISWPDSGDDFDVYVHKGSNSGPIAGSGAEGGAGPEVVELDPSVASIGTGVFTVHVIYWLVLPTNTHSGKIEVIGGATPTPTVSPTVTPTPTPAPGKPRFFHYYPAAGVADDAGEPSIGINWNTENVARAPGQTFKNRTRSTNLLNTIFNGGTSNYYGGFLPFMLRATFDDCSSPAGVQFDQMPVTLPAAPRVFGDPILFTDHITGRTFVNQEVALTPAGSTMEFTDDDGETFFPSQGAAPSGVDHQTVGGGPFHAPLPPGLVYPHAVYYASQAIATAISELSLDGGVTFPVETPIYNAADCTGLHGHIKIAEDGTAYIPNKVCSPAGVPFVFGGSPAVVVSENNGATWDIRRVPGVASDAGVDDASVGVSICPPGTDSLGNTIPCDKTARSNTIYLGFMYDDGRPGVAVSNNRGVNWDHILDLSTISNVKHIAFPEMVAGDPDRATFAFFGTETSGDFSAPEFPGVWYMYTATTFDGGVTWAVENITPGDPIQRGGICGDGTCRNLLDFFDIQLDKQGRVMIAGEDGCIAGCVNGGSNSFTAKAFITRQSGGKRMFSVFDPVEPAIPQAPRLEGFVDAGNTAVTLSWQAPDNGGSPITSYKIFRSAIPGGSYASLSPIATVTGTSFIDTTFGPGPKFYVVTAVNGQGEGPFCNEFTPAIDDGPTRCDLPGLLVNYDLLPDGSDNDSGQNVPIDGRVNAKQLHIAEPFVQAGTEQLFFTLDVAPSTLASAPPNSQWYIVWNRQGTQPSDPNDASFDRLYVAMKTDASGAPSFEYGKFGIPINTSPPPLPDPNANTPVKYGDVDSGSYDPLTGLIKITISNTTLRTIDGGATKYQAGTDLASTNVRTYFNRPDPGQRSQNNASDITGDGTYTLGGNAACAPAVAAPTKVVSRRTHGSVGLFDIQLFPMFPPGSVAIEPRSGNGASDSHQVVFTFAQPVTVLSSAATSDSGGSATVSSTTVNGNDVTVNLTGVTNAQTLTITLNGVSAGGSGSNPVAVQMAVLLGDTTADRAVNSADISQTKSKSGTLVTGDNFRNDVNVDGNLNSADIGLVKSKSGTALPNTAERQRRGGGKKR